MLDDANVLGQRDPENTLGVAAEEWKQTQIDVAVTDGDHDGRAIANVVVTGLGDSALAALIAKAWLDRQLSVPFEVAREYDLPAYVDASTLVIGYSYSGNTEETLGCIAQAKGKGAQCAVIAAGGKLVEQASTDKLARVVIPADIQPRMAIAYNLKALASLLANFGIIHESTVQEVSETAEFLQEQTQHWLPSVSTDKNQAKLLALLAVGKTPVFYGGRLTASLAYKWKINWNQNAKNVAFWNVYPEASHNEFVGWSSHPVDKPFAVFDLKSSFEHDRILQRFDVTDRLLSGLRPKAVPLQLEGDSLLKQLLWGCILADFVSIYVAVLNGVDPAPVALVDKLKKELG